MMFVVRTPFLYLLRYYRRKTVLSSLLVTTATIIVSLAIEHISAESRLLDERIVTIFIIASIISCISLFAVLKYSVIEETRPDEKFDLEEDERGHERAECSASGGRIEFLGSLGSVEMGVGAYCRCVDGIFGFYLFVNALCIRPIYSCTYNQ